MITARRYYYANCYRCDEATHDHGQVLVTVCVTKASLCLHNSTNLQKKKKKKKNVARPRARWPQKIAIVHANELPHNNFDQSIERSNRIKYANTGRENNSIMETII